MLCQTKGSWLNLVTSMCCCTAALEIHLTSSDNGNCPIPARHHTIDMCHFKWITRRTNKPPQNKSISITCYCKVADLLLLYVLTYLAVAHLCTHKLTPVPYHGILNIEGEAFERHWRFRRLNPADLILMHLNPKGALKTSPKVPLHQLWQVNTLPWVTNDNSLH